MSFPNIPDITPCINITLEDAVNLLLTSIALEEVSLSKLMDAEACKILCVLKDCKSSCHCEKCILQDALLVNDSVNDTMQNMIKMQMLLQFKLEKVKGIIPTTSTTTTTFTTTCSTSTCSTTTKKPCRCCLSGCGNGMVTNLCDEFNGHTAILKAFASCCDVKNRSIRYVVGKNNNCLSFCAAGCSIIIECPPKRWDTITMYGKGCLEKKSYCGSVLWDTASFHLTVGCTQPRRLFFKMEIVPESRTELSHNSGFVQMKDGNSTLALDLCQ